MAVQSQKMNAADLPKSFNGNIKKIINIKKKETEVSVHPLPHSGTNPNLFIKDSPAHKFKVFPLYYPNSKAEMGEWDGKRWWNLPSDLGYPSDLQNPPPAVTSASQTGSMSNIIAVAFDILGEALK